MTMSSQPGERALEGQANDTTRTFDDLATFRDAMSPVPQRQAIEVFTRALCMAEQATAASARSREMRMDSVRRMEVLRREHRAVIARAHEQLQAASGPQGRAPSRRIVIAHRNE